MQAAKAQNFALVLAEQIADGGVLQILQIEALKIRRGESLLFQLTDEGIDGLHLLGRCRDNLHCAS